MNEDAPCRYHMNKIIILFLLYPLFIQGAKAGGIRGQVFDENQEPIPYATIFISELNTGTTTNIEGFYELTL